MPLIVFALLIAAVMGGGASLAAQSALPGEPLWGFKTAVFEKLQQGADIAAIRTRLQEAKALSARGALDASARAEIRSNIAAHAAAIEKQITERAGKSDYVTAAALATNLQAALAEAAGTLDVRVLLDTASNLSAEVSAKVKQ